ncbi:uncharacterized protein LOC122838912 [Gambusia affinis]|uniref:uncharacterized protein LOC122838912 n=1 Tax=Gambusia affinis TaxID=33528 RepID=UPI001CDC8433|nr:uncharacterized protein LOC122838912 [Gambusia affinis]
MGLAVRVSQCRSGQAGIALARTSPSASGFRGKFVCGVSTEARALHRALKAQMLSSPSSESMLLSCSGPEGTVRAHQVALPEDESQEHVYRSPVEHFTSEAERPKEQTFFVSAFVICHWIFLEESVQPFPPPVEPSTCLSAPPFPPPISTPLNQTSSARSPPSSHSPQEASSPFSNTGPLGTFPRRFSKSIRKRHRLRDTNHSLKHQGNLLIVCSFERK